VLRVLHIDIFYEFIISSNSSLYKLDVFLFIQYPSSFRNLFIRININQIYLFSSKKRIT